MGAIGKQPDKFQQKGSGLSPSVTFGRYPLNTYGDLLPQLLQLWQAGGARGLVDGNPNLGHIHSIASRRDTTAAYPNISSEAIVDIRVVVSIACDLRTVSR
jgi:hypothetical protein